MQNSMPNVQGADLHYVFDMKGSQINREVLKHIPTPDLKKKSHTGGEVLKDLDYVRLKECKRFMKLSAVMMSKLAKNIAVDVRFL